jgi:hypothetical protein
MATEIITCPRCGFEATYVGMGRKGRIDENLGTKRRRCLHSIEGNGDADNCPEFAAAMTRPGKRV